jgi:NAD(P)-dependent dehydrogenase (short-subunit alcohol dehydrogenase family)
MRKLAIITGATRGLGFALTQRLLAEGMRVVAIGRRLDNLKSQKEEYGSALRTMSAELGTHDGIRAASCDLRHVVKGEQVHYLVNCAGIITPIGPITTIDLADFLQLMNVNFFAAFQLINVLIPQFADGARVLSVSSRAAELHLPGLGMYCVSKAALESLTGSYQVELAKVSVSTCIPGEVDTDMQSDLRSGPQSPSSDPDSLGGFFDQQFFLKNKTRLIPPAISARFLYWLLTGPDSEEFEAKRPWTIYDQEVQPRWLEKGEAFSYECP